MKSLANEFFKTMEDGARKHQAAHADAYELVATGIKDEQDVARQIEIVEQMIARNVQAIVLAPADSRALVAVAQRAAQAGHRRRQHRQPLRCRACWPSARSRSRSSGPTTAKGAQARRRGGRARA